MTWSPSPARSSPWSTNTQTSWSPIARCSSAATTDESTPPDSPSSTRSRAHLLAHARDGIGDDVARLPARLAGADLAHEALDQPRTLQRVRDLGVELHGVVTARLVRHRGERRIRRRRHWHEARRQRVDAVAVAHPHVEHGAARAVGVVAQAVEQPARRADGDLRVAELAMIGRRDAATELLRHGLHAVADAEHRHAGLEHRRGRARRLGVGHRLGAAGEDDAARAERADVGVAHVPGVDLAVDARLAHAARDELRVLGAEVEDQDPVGVDVGRSDDRRLS